MEASAADNTAVGGNLRKMGNSHCTSRIRICEKHNLSNAGEVQRRQRLGGMLNYYYRAAA
jgi:hypothetical protein